MKQISIILIILVIMIGGIVFLSKSLNKESSDNLIVSSGGLHWHPELEIYIKGEKQEIPADIGLIGNVHNPLHTHDPDGIIHLEYQSAVYENDIRLSNFFKVWGKKFNSNQIFDYINGEEGTVGMTVNGESNTEFENYKMQDGDKIVIRFE